ncbi:YbaB/EbfC family nucleoid-associated protein [Microbacterium sp. NPDC058342]|uniref:YbaB/EbfC family nucleoid-associated protein n=1 Tax=Microbacterium sp. NPDC058342 TaxID=3346454 RepID=UPI003656FA70
MRFTGEELEQMIAEMAETQASIAGVEKQLSELSATVVSKDRLVSATVDAQGAISELKLSGQSWREMSAKELTTKIIDAVTQAQHDVAERSAALLAGIAPEGIDPMSGLPDGIDMESMMTGLLSQFGSVTHE